ncbi:substrate-binding periplasmic protein [Nitrospirillum amazonense]|uniref:substrate-binding periplasmic protein n=1 Tax=Nitrospirillum amazonense TaxID=28077 RepID=UPI0024124102|nr:transporter substrate-binding domain-containing protein [Nitrospirillum amazonense]MDG3443221.1 transporter substrate-binding domain-containing protein [Nitrospirillum amazonense]
MFIRAISGGAVLAVAGRVSASRAMPEDTGAEAGPVRFLLSALPLWTEGDGDGATGPMPDLARAILRRAGQPGHLEVMPQLRLYDELMRAGTVVFALSDNHPPDSRLTGTQLRGAPGAGREGMSAFAFVPLAPVLQMPLAVVARTGTRLVSQEDVLALGPVASTRTTGGSVARLMDRLGVPLVPAPSLESALRMLRAGRVNGVVGAEVMLDALISRLGLADELGSKWRVGAMEGWLSCSRDAAATKAAQDLRRAADELRAEGVFDQIVERYLGAAVQPLGPVP